MENDGVELIREAIEYMESHLEKKLDLDTVAGTVHYSKYHFHRIFTLGVGMTPHNYVQRRRLTEAARQLVFTRVPILEIAAGAGYESQQAFTGIFKAMYKCTPLEYRERESFYPLQLPFVLTPAPSSFADMEGKVVYATQEDIPDWMGLTKLVINGFPCFDEAEHRERLVEYISERRAVIMWNRGVLVGAAAFSSQDGSIDFLGVHPQYHRYGVEKALLSFILDYEMPWKREVSITTFREGDRADTGQRAAYQRLGFEEGELLTEFGYPTQRLVLRRGERAASHE